MKTFKKLFAYSAIFALLATMMPTYANAASYDAELTEAYAYAKGKSITTMDSIDNADMYGNLTRVAMAKMVANYVLDLGLQELDTTKECTFPDVSEALDAAYDNGVTKACQLGLMGVGIEKFNPNGIVTRAEFGTVLSRALWGEENNGGNPYYAKHLQALKDEGIMNKIDNPNMKEVRGYVMLMMMRADDAYTPTTGCSAEELLACLTADNFEQCIATCSEDAEEEILPGFVTVSRVGSVDTQYVPKNAVNKKIGTIKLTAGENDTTVTSVVVAHHGLGEVNSNMRVKLLNNGVNVTTERPMSTSTKTAAVRFSPNLVLKAGSSMEFDVVVSLSGAENNRHEFSVSDVIVANGSSAGAPISLGSLHTTSYNVKTIEATDISLAATADIIAGKTQEKIADIKIISPDVNAKIKWFTLTRAGDDVDLRDAFANAKLYHNNNVVGNVVVNKDKIVVSGIDFDSIDAEQVSFVLKADTTYIGVTKVIQLKLLANDIIINEINSGEQMRTEEIASNNVDLAGADFVITKMTSGNKTVAPGTSAVELFNAKITSTNEFEVTQFVLTVTGTALTGFDNFTQWKVTIYVNGVDYEWTGGVFTGTKDDKFSVAPGQSATVRVVGNLKNTAPQLGAKYRVKLEVQRLQNPAETTDFALTPVKDSNGDEVTVNNWTYSVSKPSTMPTNKTILEGTAVDVLFFDVRASAENQTLQEVKVTEMGGVNFDTYATKMELVRGNTVLKTFNESDLNAANKTFSGFSTELTKDEVTSFTVRVTLKNGTVENLGKTVQLQIANASTDMKVVRSNGVETTSAPTSVNGNLYYISTTIPTIKPIEKLSKVAKIEFKNNSNYDVLVSEVKVEMTRTYAPWTAGYMAWGPVNAKFLDAVNWTGFGTTTGTVPGIATVTFAAPDFLLGVGPVERAIEILDTMNNIQPEHYTVTVKEAKFKFIDRNDSTKSWLVITETYSDSL